MAASSDERDKLSEPDLRDLIQSMGIWLLHHGVCDRRGAPAVLQQAGFLLEQIIPLELVKDAGRGEGPISHESR